MKDRMSKAQRSYCMSRVRSKNTSLELIVAKALKHEGLVFRRNVSTLPGKPDFLFTSEQVAIFVDGDFWHGWRFPCWKKKMSAYWKGKIAGNINRDRNNFRKLRRAGWRVLRFWGHSIDADISSVVKRVRKTLAEERSRVRS